MSGSTNEHIILKSLEVELQTRLLKEIDKATERIKAHLRAQVGQMALSILKQYEITNMGDTITIRVYMKELKS